MRSQVQLARSVTAVACLGITSWASAGEITFRTVALEGDVAPGTGGQTYFVFSEPPSINSAGQTAFPATTDDFVTGIWSEGSGALALVARQLEQAPGAPAGVVFLLFFNSSNAFSRPLLNDAGKTTFNATLTGPAVGSRGIWSDESGTLALVARGDDQAPGTAEGVKFLDSFFWSRSPRFNNAGQTAFTITLTGPGVSFVNDAGVWAGSTGAVALVAREGDPAPGTAAGVVFGNGITAEPVLNGAGQVVFATSLTGPGVDASNGSGIWAGGSGSLNLVVRAGDVAPGTGGALFTHFFDTVINDAGQTAFKAGLFGGATTGVWSEGSGSLALVALQGDQAPGTAAGVTFNTFTPMVVNALGHTLIKVLLTGPGVTPANDIGYWSTASGTLALVAREGDPAPGTDAGVVFETLNSSPTLNGAGHIAFHARLTGPGVTTSNRDGIWVQTPGGVLTLVVRMGDVLEVAPADFRTVSGGVANFDFNSHTGGQDGRPTGFADDGQLGFRAEFTDGSSGLFVASTAAAVPGDLDGDGVVGITDFLALLSLWGPCPDCPATPCPADLDGDCIVGITDFLLLLANWG